MKIRKAPAMLACGLAVAGVVLAFQRPFREFDGIEHRIGETPLPPDYQEKTEFAFARLMYPPGEGAINGYYGRDLDWHTGISDWSQDFPPADRHFSQHRIECLLDAVDCGRLVGKLLVVLMHQH